jgi:phosphonopyruvate decarboxylase
MTSSIVDRIKQSELTFLSSVPCSILNPILSACYGTASIQHVTACSEGEAIGIASGAWLAGKNAGVMMQNSGLGNAVNPLTSLNFPFQIPLALFISWRVQPGRKDEPQHELIGKITPSLLDLMQVKSSVVSPDSCELDAIFSDMKAHLNRRQSYALIIPPEKSDSALLPEANAIGSLRSDHFDLRDSDDVPTRYSAMEACLSVLPEHAAVIATTGKTGRELFTISDQERFFYQVGSMGCASAISLGVALNTKLPVCVFDGDGAALMKLGNLATIGSQSPRNLMHVIFDNGVYDSTGGQRTSAGTTDLAGVAKACGYRVYQANSLAGLKSSIKRALDAHGPTLIHMKISTGSVSGLLRPTVMPPEVSTRFRRYLLKHSS